MSRDDDPAYFKIKDLLARYQIGKSKLYADIQRGIFPAPEKIGSSSRWSANRVYAYEEKMRRNAER